MNTTRPIHPIDKQMMIDYIRENLTLQVKTTSEYTGGMDGGDLYKDVHVLKLVLEGEVISEVDL